MIHHDAQLRLQAYLDGELPAAEAAEVHAWLDRDAEAQLLLTELRNTTGALAGHEAGIGLPESREFFWSRIEREITRLEQPAKPQLVPLAGWLAWIQQQFAPLVGVAALVVLLGVLFMQSGHSAAPDSGEIELAADDMHAHTFRDEAQRMTVVWHSDRADSEFTMAEPVASLETE
jgi:anti-sigma factor RsiW